MKKILIFSLTYEPFVGGAEVAIQEITNRIDGADFEFHMVTLRFDAALPRYEKNGNVHVHRVGFVSKKVTPESLMTFPSVLNKYLFPFYGFLKARKLEKKERFSAAWIMMANYAGFAGVFFKMRFPKIPMLLTLQEGDPIPYIKARVRCVYPLFKKIFTRADYIQTISNYLAGFAREMGAHCPIEVVPNGVDIEHFNKGISEGERERIRGKYGVEKGDFLLVTTSRLVKKNGVGDVISALSFLPRTVKFLILGIGPLEKELRERVRVLGLEDRVYFVGQVTYKNIPDFLHASDAFIRPSLSEGMGNSFIEAMAAGVPVIATLVGGIPDFLEDDKTGIAVLPQNPESIANGIQKLVSDPLFRAELAKNAREKISGNYEWNVISQKMARIFATMQIR